MTMGFNGALPQRCLNGHPADNEGRCRKASCPHKRVKKKEVKKKEK